ncbi:MAG: flagellar hook-basal body complex protein [Deltaproteobacteria bacterium]|nr:flagellar hook-basal body complex protein [Deltaproteobacteria bacterium]
MTDNSSGPSGLAVSTFGFSTAVNPFGDTTLASNTFNVTTVKKQVVSTGRALSGAATSLPITADSPLASVYNGGLLTPGTILTFSGHTSGNPAQTVVAAPFVVGTDYGPPLTAKTNTVRDLLSWLENTFDAEASIDGAGRLVLTDRVADATGGYGSLLDVTATGTTGINPFGAAIYTAVAAHTNGEDGSRDGITTSLAFSNEALSTTQYANSSTTIFQDQNGYAAGFLQSVSVDTKGVITGNYSNGQVLAKAQVALASFNNLAGLMKEGGNIFRQTTASGAPVTGAAGTNGLGSISPNSLEQSNVDLGAEFVKLITTQRGFQANSKIITTTDEMLSDLINIKR